GFQTWGAFAPEPGWYDIVGAAALAVVAITGAMVFLQARDELFQAQPALSEAKTALAAGASIAAIDRATEADLARLDALLRREQVWREEGLTIASLARRAGLPEHQLRRLINDHLGHRNFPSFVNGHRINAAKERLSDPNEARVAVSAIAFDL